MPRRNEHLLTAAPTRRKATRKTHSVRDEDDDDDDEGFFTFGHFFFSNALMQQAYARVRHSARVQAASHAAFRAANAPQGVSAALMLTPSQIFEELVRRECGADAFWLRFSYDSK